MTITSIPWLIKGRPLCDVPWYGIAPIKSTGDVHFCCYSDAMVGNIHQNTFMEIWNGSEMQEIRAALANQIIPKQCQKSSCPIYRNDPASHLLYRMDGTIPGAEIKSADLSEHLSQSLVRIFRRDESNFLELVLKSSASVPAADLFVCAISKENSKIRFLPQQFNFPTPYAKLPEGAYDLRIEDELPEDVENVFVALFKENEDPNILHHCRFVMSASRQLE